MTTVLESVTIPTWALCYLVNGDSSGLEPEDKKLVDDWVEQTRKGGCLDVCCQGSKPYFTGHPAFGLACDVEDCDVFITKGEQDG